MVIENEKIILRNGSECILRSPMPEDAEPMLDYLRTASAETQFMLRYPEEIRISFEQERAFIKEMCASPDRVMLAAFVDGALAANASLMPVAPFEKTRHRAEFGIAVLKAYWSLGIGTVLLMRLIKTAPSMGFTQIELDVAADNTRAAALYKKHGFTEYGRRKNGFVLKDGGSLTELLMYREV